MGSEYDEIDTLCNNFDMMRKELKRARKREKYMKKERNMLLANISHDLKTPITSIKGYVIGATMRLWTYSDSCNMKHEGCCAESAVEDARRVCDKLGIDFYVMNFKDMFKDKVVDYFVDEYIHGRTPNPCIACNKYLKFDALLKKALAMGIDYVATGHYAKIEKGEDDKYICLLYTSPSPRD